MLRGIYNDLKRLIEDERSGDHPVQTNQPYYQLAVIRGATALIDYGCDDIRVKCRLPPAAPRTSFSNNFLNVMNLIASESADDTKAIRKLAENMAPLRNWASHPRSRATPTIITQNGGIEFQSWHPSELSNGMLLQYALDALEVCSVLAMHDQDGTWVELARIKNILNDTSLPWPQPEAYPTSSQECACLGLSAMRVRAVVNSTPCRG